MKRLVNKIFIHEGRVSNYHIKITHKGNIKVKDNHNEIIRLVDYNNSNALHLYNECNDKEALTKAIERLKKDYPKCIIIHLQDGE